MTRTVDQGMFTLGKFVGGIMGVFMTFVNVDSCKNIRQFTKTFIKSAFEKVF